MPIKDKNYDDLPRRESKKKNKDTWYGPGCKSHYYSVKRQIKGSVGKLWDTVFSSIKDKIDKLPDNHWMLNAVERDVNIHIKEVKVVGKKKIPFNSKDEPVYDRLWVHPKTRIVMKAVKRPVKNKVKLEKYISVDGHNFRVIDGIWYDVELIDIPIKDYGFSTAVYKNPEPETAIFPIFDAVVREDVTNMLKCNRIHNRYSYAKSKKQVDKRTIKKYSLTEKFAGDEQKKDINGIPITD